MKKLLRFITALLAVIALGLMENSCDVHEFPDPDLEHQVVLALKFDRDLPVHKVVEVETKTASKSWTKASDDPADYDIRHVVQIYRANHKGEFDRTVFRRLSFTNDDVSIPSDSLMLTLPTGTYRFIIWTDNIVEKEQDFFYSTQQFEEISLIGEHIGCNDLRDAFRGSDEAEVVSGVKTVIPISMERPLAKFTFISTDFEEFRTKLLAMLAAKAAAAAKAEALLKATMTLGLNGIGPEPLKKFGKADSKEFVTKDNETKAIDLNDYKVVFTYSGFMPSAYNLYTMKPADAKTGVSFETRMSQLDDNSAQLGFDYVIVNGDESSVNVTITTYDMDGNLMSQSDPYEVPLMRSKHTIVKGDFLTTMSSGAVGIDPGFDGEFNVVVP